MALASGEATGSGERRQQPSVTERVPMALGVPACPDSPLAPFLAGTGLPLLPVGCSPRGATAPGPRHGADFKAQDVSGLPG